MTLACCTLHSQVPTCSSLVPFSDSESLVDEKQGTNAQMSPACFGHHQSDGMEGYQYEGIFKSPAKVFHVLSHTFLYVCHIER